MIKKLKNKKGITLIALIITIIVMLILVAVTISMAINGGLFEKAGEAVGDTKNEINKEQGLANGGITIDGTYYNSIDEYLGAGVHDWTRTVDTFTCSHCGATYEMGQVVNYTAKGEKTSTTVSAEKSGLDKYLENLDENGNQIIEVQNTNWVVLGIEDTNKDGKYETLLITTEEPLVGSTNAYLEFTGVALYNYLPDELTRICKELYSNSEYGEARGMTIEDVNSCFDNLLQSIGLEGVYREENNYKTTGNLTTKLKDLPTWNTIKINHYTPDGRNTEEALGEYELNGYYYSYLYDESLVTEAEKKIIFGNDNFFYFLASRGVGAWSSSDCVTFGPGGVYRNTVGVGGTFFYSDGHEVGAAVAFRPVVTLISKLPEVKLPAPSEN